MHKKDEYKLPAGVFFFNVQVIELGHLWIITDGKVNMRQTTTLQFTQESFWRNNVLKNPV